MNIKPLHLNVTTVLIGIVVAVATCAYLALAVLPLWESLAPQPVVAAVSWAVFAIILAALFFAEVLLVRTLLLTAVAVYLRGVYAFSWLPSKRDSRAYSEWAFERKGMAYMGLRLGRLQIILLGTPLSSPTAAA